MDLRLKQRKGEVGSLLLAALTETPSLSGADLYHVHA